jgi:hypothetical protein
MKTTDIFKINRASHRLNESMEKTFGRKLNLESFDLPKLEDARNKLRTQLSQERGNSGFNENLNNDTYIQAQWMLDSINSEILQREEAGLDIVETSTQGGQVRKLKEGEIQQASAIVTAKTMVDRVGRWIEELSGMENDTLLTLGDSIRDEMSQEQAKQFISTVAPAIQSALASLKDTREVLASGVRQLTGEEQSAEMLGGRIPGEPDNAVPGEEQIEPVEPDMMNVPDEFAAAEPAAGGFEAAGREKRESINFQNRVMKVLAG